jgi:phosphate transport system substrate-binding protein
LSALNLGRAKSVIAVLALAVCCGSSGAQQAAFVPQRIEGGVIRSWGNDAMGGVMAALQDGFRRYHPEVTFQNTLYGSGTGMAGIITGVSELSLMGRPVTANEVIGFEWVHRYKPLEIQVMTGSLTEDGKTPALAILVSARNPATKISMAQLAAILGCPGERNQASTWAMAGVQGEWAVRAIHAYLYDSSTGTGAFLQQAVLGEGDRWNWADVREFKDVTRPNGTVYAAGRQIVDALRKDPNGLAVSTLGYAGTGVKALALSGSGDAVTLSNESLSNGSYPLARGVYIDVNRKPGTPLDARVKEFLSFILSEEGQDLVRRQGDYLPLSKSAVQEQRKKLE